MEIVPDKQRRRRRTPERLAREAKERRVARVEKETLKLLEQDRCRAAKFRPPRDRADYADEGQNLNRFILEWARRFGTRVVQVRYLSEHADMFEAAWPDIWWEWNPISAGRLLATVAKRTRGTYQLRKLGATNGAHRWQLVNVAPSQFEEEA